MGSRNPDRVPLAYRRARCETVQQMLDQRWEVTSRCRTCSMELRVDLRAIACVRGAGFSLWNRNSRRKGVRLSRRRRVLRQGAGHGVRRAVGDDRQRSTMTPGPAAETGLRPPQAAPRLGVPGGSPAGIATRLAKRRVRGEGRQRARHTLKAKSQLKLSAPAKRREAVGLCATLGFRDCRRPALAKDCVARRPRYLWT